MNPDTSSTWSHSFHRPRTPHALPSVTQGLGLFSRIVWAAMVAPDTVVGPDISSGRQPISRVRAQITWYTLPKSDRRRREHDRVLLRFCCWMFQGKARRAHQRFQALLLWASCSSPTSHTCILIRELLALTRVIAVLTWLSGVGSNDRRRAQYTGSSQKVYGI